MSPVYLDNAATSFPKPPRVREAVARFMRDNGASSGRGSYGRALAAEELTWTARTRLAALFGIAEPSRIILTSGATEAINLGIMGAVRPGDHVVTTSMEHNAVSRTLRALETAGTISVTVVPCLADGSLEPGRLEEALRKETRLVVMVHASNVTGTLLPVSEVGAITRKRDIILLVDAAQTAGVVPLDAAAWGIDLLAFPGHKGLLGPQGTGGLYVGPRADLRPVKFGGTGRDSLRDTMPDGLPDRYEAGTPNMPGIAGLGEGVGYLLERGVASVRKKEKRLLGQALSALADVPGIALYGPCDPERQVGVISLNIAGLDPEQVARALDNAFGIMVRAGLHCAPSAHRTIGTVDRGTIRVGLGLYNTGKDIELLADALREIARLI